MKKSKVWATSEEGKIKYVSLTADRLEETIFLINKSFFPHENVCKVLGIADKPEAIDELRDLIISAANDGVSLVAIDTETGKVVGARIGKIQHKNTMSQSHAKINEYIEKVKHQETKDFLKLLRKLENQVDKYSLYNADCVLKFLLLTVSPEYSQRGIGFKLFKTAVEMAIQLYKGKNVKTPLNDIPLSLEPRPEVVTTIFTTFKTQKIGEKLNFDVLAKLSYEDMYHNGKSFASIMADQTKECKIVGKRLY